MMEKLADRVRKIVEIERKKKAWKPSDIELLRLVLVLLRMQPSEEQLEWVFTEIREIAAMAREESQKKL